MKPRNARKAILQWALAVVPALAVVTLVACLDTRPKDLRTNGRANLSPTATNTVDSFKFNFAYRDAAAAAPVNTFVYLQGSTLSKSNILKTCNTAGSSCVCEFLDSSEDELEESDSTEIQYVSAGNFLRCQYDGVLGDLAKVRLRNISSYTISEIYDIQTSLTAAEILGEDLENQYLRSVSRYRCVSNFLQKLGTTTSTFDCSTQASLCGTAGTGDFCILQSSYPFFLYGSTRDTNYGNKMIDELYGPSGSICGTQVRRYDCSGANGTPTKWFGLYAKNTSIYSLAVSLAASPNAITELYGYAAPTATFQATTVCPPGLTRMTLYQTTTDTTLFDIASNYPNALVVSDINPVGTTPASIVTTRLQNGDCNGTACTLPATNDGALAFGTFAYGAVGTEFCVIPSTLLP